MLWAGSIRDVPLGPVAAEGEQGHAGWRRGLAEGAGVTIAATLSTAPLMAHDFDAVSIASVPANLLVVPAVAPLMWLGMLAALVGQLPGLPVQPLTGLAGLLAAYVAQIAHWLGSPGWARASVPLPSAAGVLAAYVALALVLWVLLAWARRRGGLQRPPAAVKPLGLAACLGVLVLATAGLASPGERRRAGAACASSCSTSARATRSCSTRPTVSRWSWTAGRRAMTFAAGSRTRVSALAAAVVTHDQSDHAGGSTSCSARSRSPAALRERGRDFLQAARGAGVRRDVDRRGSEIDSGSLRIEVLCRPGRSRRSLRRAIRTRRRSCCLPGGGLPHASHGRRGGRGGADRPRPIDVLKVAHHGSDDAGLDSLLDRSVPRLAVISVGAQPYGHPTRARSPPSPSTTSRSFARTRRRRDDRRHIGRLAGRDPADEPRAREDSPSEPGCGARTLAVEPGAG
jgi:competence protein ComEC